MIYQHQLNLFNFWSQMKQRGN